MQLLRARVEDVLRIEECARLCCEEHGEDRCGGKLNWPHYRDGWIDLISRDQGVIFYHEENGAMVGGFGGGWFVEMLTGLKRAQQIFHYYKPEYRGRVSARRLVREFEKWAVEHGCSNVTLPLLDTMPEKTAPFYERLGYAEQTTTYLKMLSKTR